ncbi:MAG: hypothetical protein KDK70_44280, partial [Myxococcales bacterium]|nr:hypothetical protein [Myxococcales bacterium]
MNDGLSSSAPVATIGRALAVAADAGGVTSIVVAGGTYTESIALRSGVSVVGGFEPVMWTRDLAANETVLVGVDSRTVIADGLTEPTRLDGFTIRGASFVDSGTSTYGVWVRNVASGVLTIADCRIEAGTAGRGDDGANGADGPSGGNGANGGGDGRGGAGGAWVCGATGGTGGDGTACPSTGG